MRIRTKIEVEFGCVEHKEVEHYHFCCTICMYIMFLELRSKICKEEKYIIFKNKALESVKSAMKYLLLGYGTFLLLY